MKFDAVIIGGGLAGLTAAIRLAENSRKVAVISAGGSSLMFNTGSFGLLGFNPLHEPVVEHKKAVEALSPDHPYSLIGAATVEKEAVEAELLLQRCGVKMTSIQGGINHRRLSPLGIPSGAWMTMDGLLTDEAIRRSRCRRMAVVGFAGFPDFYPRFIAAYLREAGYDCSVHTVDTDELRQLRRSATEMRAHSIARIMHGKALDGLAREIANLGLSEDTLVVLPAAIDVECFEELENLTGRKILYAPTLGVSVPGKYIYDSMLRYLKKLGGVVLTGHNCCSPTFGDGILTSVTTDKLDGDTLRAENFVLVSGSFFGRGLLATPDTVIEPALGTDVAQVADRESRFNKNLFDTQPLMKSGVMTDALFRARTCGRTIENLYVAGAILAGADSAREESGAGVAMLTALRVSDLILNLKN